MQPRSHARRPTAFLYSLPLACLLLLSGCTSQPVAPVSNTTATTQAAPTTQPPAATTTLATTSTVTPAVTATTTSTTTPAATAPQTPAATPATAAKHSQPAATDKTQTATQAAPTNQTGEQQTATTAKPKPAQQLTKAHPLEPFKASFRIYVSKIPMPITAELELSPQSQPDTWKMRFEVHSFLMHNLEESTFTWNNCHPKSIHYHHDFKGFGKHQFHDTTFSWNPPQVTNHSDEDNKSFAIPADSVDDLTVLLQAACVFSEGATDYYATSIYGDQIRDNHFKLVRRETIKTPLGKLDTLVVEKERVHDNGRHTLFWIAPKLNYMLVKAKHIENPVLFGEVIMRDYEGPHQPEK